MNRKLPSFPALRAFEAAARHLSFKEAAGELCVSPSAISHQVKSLEDFLGAPLFIRHPQSVELTLRGSEYLAMVSYLMDGLDAATRKIKGKSMVGSLRVQASPAFASHWLLPRILRFNQAYPDVEINLSTISRSEDPEEIDFDVRINCPWEVPPDSDTGDEAFLSSARVPVCSPGLLQNGAEVTKPADLLGYPILRETGAWDGWDQWFVEAGFEEPPEMAGPVMENVYLTQKAAEYGQGITLGVLAFVREKIELGQLVQLLESQSVAHLYYSISYAKHWRQEPKIVAFRDWLHDEAGQFSELDFPVKSVRTSY